MGTKNSSAKASTLMWLSCLFSALLWVEGTRPPKVQAFGLKRFKAKGVWA